jgi:hypothetical protein
MKKNSGMTLLEVVIASAILTGVVLASMVIFHSSSGLATKGSLAADLEDRGRRLTSFAQQEFVQARYTGQIALGGSSPLNLGIDPAYFNTSLGYQMPGTGDPAGVALPAGTVVFGYLTPRATSGMGFHQDLAVVIRFEADTVIKESAASPDAAQLPDWGAPFPNYPLLGAPQIVNADINRDGDQADTFVRGRLKKYILAPQGSVDAVANGANPLLVTEVLDDFVILPVNPAQPNRFNGSMSSHVAAPPSALDPLFLFVDQNGPDGVPITNANLAIAGRGLQIVVWHGNWDDTGKGFYIRKNSLTINFRNPQ